MTAGQWQHVVAIYDNGSMRFYHNGTEYTTNDQEGNHSSTGKFTIGVIKLTVRIIITEG